jgi:hypothetical protein
MSSFTFERHLCHSVANLPQPGGIQELIALNFEILDLLFDYKGGHTLLLRGERRGFDPRHLRRTKRAFFSPLAI